MHIPEEYRERFDNLARSHPWMWDMVDKTETVGDSIAHSNITQEEGASLSELSGKLSDNREKLEVDALMLVDNLQMYGFKYAGDAECEIIELLDRQAAITADTNKELIKWQAATVARLQKEVDSLKSYVDDTTADYAKLVKERDNLADDLLTCNREREQLRKHLGIALDHAYDICTLVDIDGNVLDIGD